MSIQNIRKAADMRTSVSNPVAPPGAMRAIATAAALIAAALVGFGVILLIAANWDSFGKVGQFALVGSLIVGASALAASMAAVRVPALLVAFLANGGLLALFGQTYQTGADPWQLFAMWAVLTLPWCLAGRHDALWTVWGAVAFTALSLWLLQSAGQVRQAEQTETLMAWMIALAIATALGPWAATSRLGQLRSGTPWAFRLAVVLTSGLVAQGALTAIFWGHATLAVYLCGLAILGGAVFALVRLKPLDLPSLGIATLAFDVVLIGGVARLLGEGLRRSGDAIGVFLFVGIVSAMIVAGSAAALLSVLRADVAAAPGAASRVVSTWPVTLLSGLGALIAAIPLLAAYALLFGWFLRDGGGTYVIGGLTFAAALVAHRASKPLGFGQQLSFIGLLLGTVLLGFGIYRDLPFGLASLLMALGLAGAAFVTPANWVRTLLGMATAIFIVMFLSSGLNQRSFALIAPQFGWLVIILSGVGALLLSARASNDKFIAGWCAAGLLGLMAMAGPTFLLGGNFAMPGVFHHSGASAAGGWSLGVVLSIACALAAATLVMASQPAARTPVGFALALVAAALAGLAPTLGPALLALAAAESVGRRSLAALAAFAVLWIFGSVYYWLGWPLIQKGQLTVGLGVGLMAVCITTNYAALASRRSAGQLLTGNQATLVPGFVNGGMAAGLIVLGSVLTAMAVGGGVWRNEGTLANGRPLYVALAPVDPRSLMQGDFMALRFALPPSSLSSSSTGSLGGMKAIATLDARGVATVSALSPTVPSLAANQIAIELTWKHGRWIVATDAFYFKEGTGRRYEAAKFGEFRFTGSGRPILVGLATADLQRIK
jgi:uncharacterized membrane-anchored protein/uncharacterized membrane protein